MLKKMVAIVLCMLLTFGAATASMAVTVSTMSTYSSVELSYVSMAACGSTIYLLTESGEVMQRTVTSAELMEIGKVECTAYSADYEPSEAAVGLDTLFSVDGQLYGLCTATGDAYKLLDDQGGFSPAKQDVKLKTSGLIEKDEEHKQVLTPTSFFYQDGWLYYTAASYANGYTAMAGRISLETGEAVAFATPNITELTPYQDGKVLALIYDASAIYGMGTSVDSVSDAAQCAVFDPQKDVLEKTFDIESEGILGGYSISGLCYGNGKAYYRDGGRVMGMDIATGETQISAYTGEGMYGNRSSSSVQYADGYYVARSYSDIIVYELDSENLKNGALTIFGEFGSKAHNSFVKNHPNIPVDVSSEYTNDIETLTQAMVSENQTYDVLKLMLGYMPVERLQKKGYCADLSGYPGLVERISNMYPQYADAMMVDGKLYGVPVEMTAQCFGVNMEKWEELGLTEEELPKSFMDVYEFAANWVYDYGEDHPDIVLFDYGNTSQILFSLMLSQYMAHCQYTGESLRFDTELFKKLTNAIGEIDFEEISALNDADEGSYWNQDALFSLAQVVGYLRNTDENIRQIYLSLDNETEPFIAGSVSVLIVNPKTTRMDQAVAYLENYLDNLDENSGNITLYPDHNEPVVNDFIVKQMEEIEKTIASDKELLNTVDADKKAEIEDRIKQNEDALVVMEEQRYAVSAERIKDYRDNVAPLVFVQKQNVLYGADSAALNEVNSLLMQYLEGAISCDQMVKSLDQRIKLMELEDE